MIQKIIGLAANVAAFRVSGEVTKDDYEEVVIPIVKDISARYDHFNFLLVINTDLKNYTLGAWIQDSLISIKNITKFQRMALVSDSNFVEKLTHLVDIFAPGEYRSFSLKDESVAKEWVSPASI